MDLLLKSNQSLQTIATVLSSAIVITFTALYTYHVHLSYQRSDEPPVIWSWIPILGNAIEMGSKPIDFLKNCSKKHKNIFGLVVAGHRMFIITDPHSSNIVFKPLKTFSWEEFHNLVLVNFFGAAENTTKSHPYDDDLMRKWFSTYILSDSALHKLTERTQIQLIKNVHHHHIPNNSNNQVTVVPLYSFLSKLIFNASVAALFNSEAGDDASLYEAFLAFDQHMPLAMAGYKVDYTHSPKHARDILLNACRKYRTLDNCELISKRWDYFDELESKGTISPQDSNAFQLTMLWASVGNTMPITFWVLYYLLSNPVHLEEVIYEIMGAYSSNNNSNNNTNNEDYLTILSQERLNQLRYTDACITEALRLSSGSLLMRHVQANSVVTMSTGEKYHFRKGDRVGVCPPLWHMDEEIFTRPYDFNPLRWLQGISEDEKTIGSLGKIPLFKDQKPLPNGIGFLPFGAGVTLCPGRRFARNEIKTLLCFLLSKFTFQLHDMDNNIPEFDGSRAGIGIFPPKNDISVRIQTKL